MVKPKTTFMREPEHLFNGKINLYSRMDLFELLEDSLLLKDWNSLCAGCLGPIVKFGASMKISAQLIHFFLMNEIKTAKQHEIWFNISGNIVRFSLVEFAAVTGLNCTDDTAIQVPNVDPYSELRVHNLTFDQLVTVFLNEKDSEKKLRWAHVLVVDGVLLSKRKDQEVDSTIYAFSSYMELFSKYALGRLSYAATISSLMNLNRSNHHIVPGSRFGYNIHGYPLAFQVWILETFPKFSDVLNVSPEYGKAIPYCVRWSSKKLSKHTTKNQVQDVANDGKLFCVMPTYSELGELKNLCFEDEVIDTTFDTYIQSLMSKDKNELDVVVRDVLADLDDLDDFALESMLALQTFGKVKPNGKLRRCKKPIVAKERVSRKENKQKKPELIENEVKNDSHAETFIEETMPASQKEDFIPSWAKELIESMEVQHKASKFIQWKVIDHSMQLEQLSKNVKNILSLLKHPTESIDDGVRIEVSPSIIAKEKLCGEKSRGVEVNVSSKSGREEFKYAESVEDKELFKSDEAHIFQSKELKGGSLTSKEEVDQVLQDAGFDAVGDMTQETTEPVEPSSNVEVVMERAKKPIEPSSNSEVMMEKAKELIDPCLNVVDVTQKAKE